MTSTITYILEDARFGGMNKMMADISKCIMDEDYTIHLIVGKSNSKFFVRYLNQHHLSFSLLPFSVLSKKKVAILRYSLTFLPELYLLTKHLRSINPDLVYCNGSQQIKGVIAASLAGMKVVWHMHDTYQPPALLFLFQTVRRICRIKWFVASCEKSCSFYKLEAPHTLLSRPPIDTVFFQNTKSPNSLINRQSVRVLTIANINSDKGIDTLVRVAAQLADQGRRFHFTIVGLGATEGNPIFDEINDLMRKLNVNTVHFIGQKDNIRSLLGKTDLYLCTSRNESGPISVFEALAMEVPVVSTSVGDLPFLFSKYNYGSTFGISDYRELSSELIRLADDHDERLRRSKIGRTIAKDELDIAICVANQKAFYQKVLVNGH